MISFILLCLSTEKGEPGRTRTGAPIWYLRQQNCHYWGLQTNPWQLIMLQNLFFFVFFCFFFKKAFNRNLKDPGSGQAWDKFLMQRVIPGFQPWGGFCTMVRVLRSVKEMLFYIIFFPHVFSYFTLAGRFQDWVFLVRSSPAKTLEYIQCKYRNK